MDQGLINFYVSSAVIFILTRGSPSKSEINDNMTLLKGLNSTYADIGRTSRDRETDKGNNSNEKLRDSKVNDESGSSEGSNNSFPLVYNNSSHVELDKSSMSKNENVSANGPAPEEAREPPAHGISFKNITKDTNSSSSSVQPKDVGLPEQSNESSRALSPSSVANDTILKYTNTESRSPVISAVTANTTSVDKQAGVKKKDKRPGSLKNNRSRSKKKSIITVPKDKTSKKPTSVVSIPEMNKLLLQSHTGLMVTQWSSPVDQELFFAKLQIENAPITENDEILHLPLYRNLSMFKRSYELMEKILKVYLMEANKNVITKDPTKAHLFYLPYSSQMLKLKIYVPNSHKRANVIKYMKGYVDMIAMKYSFWNRTNGKDHFLAACHDWAPAETRGRMLSCIRALCNADLEVGFKIGKDVSLPETYANSVEVLGNKDSDMKIFDQITGANNKTDYFHYMKSSKYCICARGHEVNSPRVVEAIFYNCVPEDVPNLKNILLSISEERYMEMYGRVEKVQQHFLWHEQPVRPSNQDGSSRGKVDASLNKKKIESSTKQTVDSKQKSIVTKSEQVHQKQLWFIKNSCRFIKTTAGRSKTTTKTTTTTRVREKKQYTLTGQKYDPPEEREPLRIFYESLSKQIPSSEMAEFWMMEHGLLSPERAKKAYEKKQRRQKELRMGTPVKSSKPASKPESSKQQASRNGDIKAKRRIIDSDDDNFILSSKRRRD
ncbi:hypothetical protein FNV43_RR12506 [Rhamnella rubrinervis]|uniref:Exostosin GT47 domain-containing protein n=1 Tax=Rhamnella rubrinervis TaxID=2594499 RepID=A0A8K0MIY2_9ROSA|nr:hypothetical protein FNV43_RR12506 [Rhamnella rubrinervis]